MEDIDDILEEIGYEDIGDDKIEDNSLKIERLSEKNIVPSKGTFLGLDISKESTGLCLIRDGEKITGNIELNEDLEEIKKSDDWVHSETLLRRRLKKYLSEVVEGVHFDVIVIEDAFSGENPEVTRMLYGLNTAIDEMILDGLCSCDKFIRVNNREWKSWIGKSVDPENKYKGLNDKIKIQYWLRDIGITEGDDKGFQDRLDSTGLLIGYFLQQEKVDQKYVDGKGINITWSNLDFAYELDTAFIYEGREWLTDLNTIYLDENERITKKQILKWINKNPDSIFITEKPVFLGFLLKDLGSLDSGGYFAFWVKKRARKKLLGEE